MTFKNTHPTLEEIAGFVAVPSGDFSKEKFREYFPMMVHFSECEKCCRIKDEMVAFEDELDSVLSCKPADESLKFKIYYSLMKLNLDSEWKDKEICMVMKGRISGQTGKSVIRECVANRTVNGDEVMVEHGICPNEVRINDSGRIVFGEEKIEVNLYDDGACQHSLLLIPENADSSPLFCVMEKSDQFWTASCECPEDDYDMIVF